MERRPMELLRCSSLPLYMRCAQSMAGQTLVKEWFAETVLGTAVHAALARWVTGLGADVEAIARLYSVDEAELRFLVTQGIKAWEALGPLGADAVVTAERDLQLDLGDVHITGTADVMALRDDERVIEVIDWKTGRVDSDHQDQVMGYCALALKAYPQAEMATARLIWLRGAPDVEVYSMTRPQYDLWRDRLLEHVKNSRDGAYHPGQHCGYCPRKFECQARIEMSKASLAVFGAEGHRTLEQLTPAEKIALYRKAKEVDSLAYRVKEEIKALVKAQGPIVGSGARLELVAEERRRLKPGASWPILQQHLTDAQLEQVVAVSLTKAQDAVAEGAPRGQGAGRKRELMAELEAAGAVDREVVEKLTERRDR